MPGGAAGVGVAVGRDRDLRAAARERGARAGRVRRRHDQPVAHIEVRSPVPVGWRSLAGWPCSTEGAVRGRRDQHDVVAARVPDRAQLAQRSAPPPKLMLMT